MLGMAFILQLDVTLIRSKVILTWSSMLRRLVYAL
jgi:hypothetical protein